MAANVNEGAAEFRLRPSVDKKWVANFCCSVSSVLSPLLNAYFLRRFSKEIAQEIIHALLSEELKNKVFEGNEQIATLCQTLSTKIKDKMKSIGNYSLLCLSFVISVESGERNWRAEFILF